MIAELLLAVESYFKDNWNGDIHFSNTEKHPTSNTWIYLEVAPLYGEVGIGGCTEVLQVVHVTVYDSNKVKSAYLADRLIRFFYGVKLKGNDWLVQKWLPVGQGEVYNGLHFRKLSFEIRTWS